jgi:hypothetical protein
MATETTHMAATEADAIPTNLHVQSPSNAESKIVYLTSLSIKSVLAWMERLTTFEIEHLSMVVIPAHFIQEHVLLTALDRVACSSVREAKLLSLKYDGEDVYTITDKDLNSLLNFALLPSSKADFRFHFIATLYFSPLSPTVKLGYYTLSPLLEAILSYFRDVASFHRFFTQKCTTLAQEENLKFLPLMKKDTHKLTESNYWSLFPCPAGHQTANRPLPRT